MRRLFSALTALLGAALALSPFVLFPVCTAAAAGGGHMKCWYSGLFITAMGVLVIAAALCAWRGRLVAPAFAVAAAAALLCWLVPNGVVPISGDGWRAGLCGDASHACNAVTMPVVGKLVAGTVIVGILGLIAGFLRRDRR